MINLFALVVIALFAFSGYKRGLVRMVASLFALLLAGIFCKIFSGLGSIFVPASVPKILAPFVAMLIVGIVLFILFDFLIGILIKKQAQAREEAGQPKVLPWEAYTGLLFGILWGVGINLLIFTGIVAIGRAQRVVRHSEDIVTYREKNPGPWKPVDETQLARVLKIRAPQEQGEVWAEKVESSVFAPVIDKVNPIDDRVEQTLTDLSVVCNDPILYMIFRSQPKVQEFMSNPLLLELAQDPEIAQAIQSGQYKEMLDNAKIVQVAQDPLLRQKLKELKIDEILADIRDQSYKIPQETPRRHRRY